MTRTRTRLFVRARTHAFSAFVALTALGTSAYADDKAACAEAYEKGQELRNKGEFSGARAELVVCAKPTCKDWMVAECTKWLDELERRQPTIVLTAENARGEAIDVVKVVDESGRALAQGVTGRAIALDPGPHELTFVARDGTQVKVMKMVHEGQQAVQVKAVFAPSAQPSAPVDAAPTAAQSPSSPWRTVGWVMGGAGVVGVGLGGIFGIVALSRKDGHCDANNACEAGTKSSVESAATVSTVSLIAGTALLAGGAAILLFGPSARSGVRGIQAAPVAMSHGGGMMMGGQF